MSRARETHDLTLGGHHPPDGDGVALVLHDLRAPLSVIQAYTEMLRCHIRQNQATDGRYLLNCLAVMDLSMKRIEAHLKELENHIGQ